MSKKAMVLLLALGLALCATPALAQGGKLGLGLVGGWAFPMASDAMTGRDGDSGPADSSFDGNWTLGAEAVYAWPSGLQLGVGVQYLSMTAEASRSAAGGKSDFADLDLTPVYALARWQYPVQTGLTGHFEAGLGYAFANADKDQAITSMESALGESVDVSTTGGLVGMVGAGADYYFCPSLSLGLNLRYWWASVDYDLSTSRLGDFSKGAFEADTLQTLLALTWWFQL